MIREAKVFFLITFLISNPLISSAQNFKGNPDEAEIQKPQKELTVEETLVYSAEWLGIPMGRIVLKIEGIKTINNRQCYHISASAIPNRVFRRFYDVEYRVSTYLDKDTLLPQRFEKLRRIGDNYNYVTIEFNYKKNEATFTYSTPKGDVEIVEFPSLRKVVWKNETSVNKIPDSVQDLFSSLYYFRLLDIKEGKEYKINITYGSGIWSVKVKIDKPFLKDIYKKGTFGVIKVNPSSDLNLYILGKHKVTVYFTCDSRRIPVEFSLSTAIGYVRGKIQNIPGQ